MRGPSPSSRWCCPNAVSVLSSPPLHFGSLCEVHVRRQLPQSLSLFEPKKRCSHSSPPSIYTFFLYTNLPFSRLSPTALFLWFLWFVYQFPFFVNVVTLLVSWPVKLWDAIKVTKVSVKSAARAVGCMYAVICTAEKKNVENKSAWWKNARIYLERIYGSQHFY